MSAVFPGRCSSRRPREQWAFMRFKGSVADSLNQSVDTTVYEGTLPTEEQFVEPAFQAVTFATRAPHGASKHGTGTDRR